jgi:hypothetical protein
MITFMEAVQAAYPNGIYGWDGVNKESLVINNVSDIDFDLIEQKRAELTASEPLRLLREQRNQLLAQSDWMALSDRTMTQAQIDYRQALRDLPATADPQLDENGNLTNVNWPEEP